MQRLVDIAPPEIHAVWEVLSAIPDPEVPVLTITDLGMVRSVDRRGDGWVIGFTPTYSGCPATEHLLGEIRAAMTETFGRDDTYFWPTGQRAAALAARCEYRFPGLCAVSSYVGTR